MIRRFLFKLLGLGEEIDNLHAKLRELSRDEPFGMLTRNAFLHYCAELPPGKRSIVFIDLNEIGSLNNLYGYTEVDRRVKSIFAGFLTPDVTIGRWYSGDEVVLLFDDPRNTVKWITKLKRKAQLFGISFVSEAGVWEVAECTLAEVIGELSARLCQQKIPMQDNIYSGGNYAIKQKEPG